MAKFIPTIDRIDDLAPPFDLSAPVDVGSIERSLFALLSNDSTLGGYVGTRIYPLVVPQSASMPAITYQQVGGVRDEVMTGPTGLIESRFQINCWAETYAETRVISNAVRKVLDGFGVIGKVTIQAIFCVGEGDMIETAPGADTLKRYGKCLDFTIWFINRVDSSAPSFGLAVSKWVSPTGDNDGWVNAANSAKAWDDNTASAANSGDIEPTSFGDWLELTHSAINCDRIRIWAASDYDVDLNVAVYYDSAWHEVSVETTGAWATGTLDGVYSVTKIRIRGYNNDEEEAASINEYEVDFGEVFNNIEQALYTLMSNDSTLGGYVGTRIYPSIVPQGAAIPAITYQQISGFRDNVMTGPTGLVESRFQINCWAETYRETRILSNAVENILDGFVGTVEKVTIQAIFCVDEGDMPQISPGANVLKRHGKRLDFIVWFEE